MKQRPALVGICVGLIISIPYCILSFIRGYPPELANVVALVLSCTGLVTAISFGYVVIRTKQKDLGTLAKYQELMVVGAVAVIWVSTLGIIKMFAYLF